MNNTDSNEQLLQQIVETPAGERIRMKCGAADLRSVIADILERSRASVAAVAGDATIERKCVLNLIERFQREPERSQATKNALEWLRRQIEEGNHVHHKFVPAPENVGRYAPDECFRCGLHRAAIMHLVLPSAAASSPPAEPAQPLCVVHQHLEDTGALECEIGNDCVACSLNERRELLQLIAPFAAEGNTEDSLTVLRRVADFYATHVGEGRVIVSYPAAIPTHKCERCSGTGEVEGYGGNMIYCGYCAGTGKKPDFTTPAPAQPEGEQGVYVDYERDPNTGEVFTVNAPAPLESDGFPCYCRCHNPLVVQRQTCVHCNSYDAYPPMTPVTPNDNVPKLLTTEEWKSLSPESCHRINNYFAAAAPPATPVVARELAEEIVLYANQQSGHAEADEWFDESDVKEIAAIVTRYFAATTTPSRETPELNEILSNIRSVPIAAAGDEPE